MELDLGPEIAQFRTELRDWIAAEAPEGLVGDVMDSVIMPAITAMRGSGTPYSGVLYAGLALTSKGGHAGAAYGIDLIYEYNTGGFLSRLFN